MPTRYDRKVNRILQAAQLDHPSRVVLAVLGGPTVGLDPFIGNAPTEDFADQIQSEIPAFGGVDFELYALSLRQAVFDGWGISDTGFDDTLWAYMDGDYPAFNGGTPAPAGQVDALRNFISADSNYDAEITGLGAQADPLAKLFEYIIANATFPA